MARKMHKNATTGVATPQSPAHLNPFLRASMISDNRSMPSL